MREKVSYALIASILLVATVSSMPGTVEAATYDGFEYTIRSDDTVEITKYVGTSSNVIIPDKIGDRVVTGIGDSLFEGRYSSLTSITIPDTITSIGKYAFAYCKPPTPITIPDGVSTIGEYAFLYCPSLKSVTLTNVTSIGDKAFAYSTSLASVTLTNVTSIGKSAFSDCSSLKSVTLTNVTSIGFGAFSWCSSLTSIIIPDSVTSIGDYAFNQCSSMTSILFRGDAPGIGSHWVENTRSDLTVYFIEGSSGFTGSEWGGKTSVAVSAPSAPAEVEADVSRGAVILTWSAPSDDGGLAGIWYEIFRKADGAELTRIGSTYATTYADESVSLGATYSYHIVAANALLSSLPSDEVLIAPDEDLTIDVRTDPSELDMGLKVIISGEVTRTYDGAGIGGLRVLFAFSVDDGLTWTALASATTSADGSFSAQWMPAATGTYVLKVTWAGDDAHLPAEATTSVMVAPSDDRRFEELNDRLNETNARLAALSDLLNRTITNVSAALLLISDINADLSELDAAHDLTTERLAAMAGEVDSLIDDLAGLRARLVSTDANATALRALLDDTIEALEITRTDLTVAQESLRQSIANTDANVTAIGDWLGRIANEVQQLNDELAKAYSEGNMTAEQLESLSAEVASLEDSLRELQSALGSTDANTTALSALLDSTINDLEEAKVKLTAAQIDLGVVQDKHSSSSSTYLTLGAAGIAVGMIAIGLFAWTRKK